MKLPYLLLIFLSVEILSFLSFSADFFMPLSFAFAITACYLLSVKKLEYGLMMVLSELIIGSLGYQFWLYAGTTKISVRIGIWFVFMAVWFFYHFLPALKNRPFFSFSISKSDFKKPEIWLAFLGVFALLGLAIGWLKGNSPRNIFFDFNGWLFFLLIFPFLTILKNKSQDTIANIKRVVLSALIWLCLKTLVLLFLFSHDFSFLPTIYKWARDTRLAEITRMEGGFVRVFMQSHIYASAAFFIFFMQMIKKVPANFRLASFKDKGFLAYFALTILTAAVSIVSLSRSNWVGMLVGVVVLMAYVFLNRQGSGRRSFGVNLNLKEFFNSLMLLTGVGALSVGIIFSLILLPIPGGGKQINAGADFKDRLFSQGDAAVSSRWDLLKPLGERIKSDFFLGSGFGSTISYKSSDPRALSANPQGLYTTYAFEWGWLDIWLKTGLLGAFSYLVLLSALVLKGLKALFSEATRDKEIILGLIFGLVVLACINFFSPYLNHPLGIGYLLFTYFFIAHQEAKKLVN